jgi:O-antigen/teichoic acid export membrane protein
MGSCTVTASPIEHENRRFFLLQYLQTMPLNFFAVGLKTLSGLAWTLVDNAKLLGFFTLSGTLYSISQQAQLASALGQTLLPNSQRVEDDRAIVIVSLIVDTGLIAFCTLAMIIFFLATRAEIVLNLGLPAFLLVSLLSLAEPVSGTATHVCNARRDYIWNFLLGNIRSIVLVVVLGVFFFSRRFDNPSWGIPLWVACTLSAFFLAWIYLYRTSLIPHREDLQLPGTRSFIANLKTHAISLILFRGVILVFASLPSFFIAYMRTPKEVGWFSFALTLSSFLYASVAPINEQIYSPSISRLVNQDLRDLLIRRLVQMSAITLVVSAAESLALLWAGKPLLTSMHKLAFLTSFDYLPVLLLYQTLLLLASGFSYALFCMNRFKELTFAYFAAVAGTVCWALVLHGDVSRVLWGLPVSTAIFMVLCTGYVLYLWKSNKTLLRRSMI